MQPPPVSVPPYDNANTATAAVHPASAKPRRARLPHFSRQQLRRQAERDVNLVPIRLDFEYDGNTVRDAFTWNLNEKLVTPEQFATIMAEDLCSAHPKPLEQLIATSIRKQIEAFSKALEEEEVDNPICIVIKLDVQVGRMHLTDQVEWPLWTRPMVTPEEFALQLTAELGLGGEFRPHVAHSIREQVCLARLNLENYTSAPRINPSEPPLRASGEEGDWSPSVVLLDVADIEKRAATIERNSRRLRRQLKLGNIGSTGSLFDSCYRNPSAYLPPLPMATNLPRLFTPQRARPVLPDGPFNPGPRTVPR